STCNRKSSTHTSTSVVNRKEYVSTATPSPVITPTPLEQKETENEGNKQPKKT
ncbi:unnamed protein product, partial [Cochlearia groenlandica]